MARFTIPEEIKEGLSQFFNLKDEQKKLIIESIKGEPIGASPSDLAKKITGKLGLIQGDVEEILLCMASLQRASESSELAEDDFINEIIYSLEKSKVKGPSLVEDIKNILANDFLRLTRKANILASNRQNILVASRIITDIRPVYGINNEKDKIKSSIIIHNLKIEYYENDEVKSIYFALDKKDLKKLMEHLERAEMKEQDMKEKFAKVTDFIEVS